MDSYFRIIFIIFILVFMQGCGENVNTSNINEIGVISKIKYEDKFKCHAFLENKLELYLACKDWKFNVDNINDISYIMKPYIDNYIEGLVGTTPIELELSRRFDVNGNVYLLYPNGFIAYFNSKKDYDEKIKLKTYICNNENCKKYFLWGFVDENIIEVDPSLDFERDIYLSSVLVDYKKKLKFNYLGNNIEIKNNKCIFLDNGVRNDCTYFIGNDEIYVYKVFKIENNFSTIFWNKIKL